MGNPLFSMLGGQNPMQMLTQLKQNPLGLLQSVGFNIPTNITNPQQIVEHLMRTGQINQSQLDQAQQMMQMFGNMK